MITPEEKAKELVNMYYGCNAKTQLEAIQQADNANYTSMCQMIDDLHSHVLIRKDYDLELIKSSIVQLKWKQEIALSLEDMKNKIPV